MNWSGNITLIGMPGSGKSTLGQGLANCLGLSFIDLDVLIEKGEEATISEMFEQQGENSFRKSESHYLRQALKQSNVVIAAGGGTPCYHDNLREINGRSISIFIDVELSELAVRLERSSSERPLLKNDLQNKLKVIYEARIETYKKARYTLSGNDICIQDILTLLEKEAIGE